MHQEKTSFIIFHAHEHAADIITGNIIAGKIIAGNTVLRK